MAARAPTDPEQVPEEAPSNETAILALLSSVVFMAVVNGTMVNVALPYIGDDFSVSEGIYGWLVTGYSLSFGIFNAIDGRLADIVGIRKLYLSGIAVLGVSAIALAFSPTIEFAIALRIIQGAGSAALPVMGATIIAQLIPPSKRGAAMGVILSVVGFAASLGPFLGGLILQFADWHWVFAVVGLVTLAIPFGIKLLPAELDNVEGGTFDLVGSILLGGGVALMMYGFNVVQDAGVGLTVGLTVGGGVLLLVLFAVWIHYKDKPFAQPSLFKNLRYMATCLQAFAANGTRFGTIVLIPIFLKEVNQLKPIWVGIVLFPGALAIGLLSRRAGAWADKRGPREPVAIGTVVLLIGNLITAFYAGGSPYGVAFGMGLTGLGFAFVQTPLLSTASQVLPQSETSGGLGIFMMILFIGGAFGVALAVTITDMQPDVATSWLGIASPAPRFQNAAITLSVLGAIGVALVGVLPNEPLAEDAEAGE